MRTRAVRRMQPENPVIPRFTLGAIISVFIFVWMQRLCVSNRMQTHIGTQEYVCYYDGDAARNLRLCNAR